MPAVTHTHGGETYTLEQGDLRYTLQIPQRELDYNPEMDRDPR